MLIEERALGVETHRNRLGRQIQSCRVVAAEAGFVLHQHAGAGDGFRNPREVSARLSAEDGLMGLAVVLGHRIPGRFCPFQRHLGLAQLRIRAGAHPPREYRSYPTQDLNILHALAASGYLRLEEIETAEQLIVVAVAVLERTDTKVIDPVDPV